MFFLSLLMFVVVVVVFFFGFSSLNFHASRQGGIFKYERLINQNNYWSSTKRFFIVFLFLCW